MPGWGADALAADLVDCALNHRSGQLLNILEHAILSAADIRQRLGLQRATLLRRPIRDQARIDRLQRSMGICGTSQVHMPAARQVRARGQGTEGVFADETAQSRRRVERDCFAGARRPDALAGEANLPKSQHFAGFQRRQQLVASAGREAVPSAAISLLFKWQSARSRQRQNDSADRIVRADRLGKVHASVAHAFAFASTSDAQRARHILPDMAAFGEEVGQSDDVPGARSFVDAGDIGLVVQVAVDDLGKPAS